jgi:diadenylate cyclase
MSEESDSLVIVVSEETGSISTAYKGQLVRGISQTKLRTTLTSVFVTPIRNHSFRSWIRSLKAKQGSVPTQAKAIPH